MDSLNLRSQSIQSCINILITALNLVAVVDDAGAVGGEGGDEQGDAGTDVGRGHADAAKVVGVVEADDIGTVRVAEDDLRAHVDEFVDEEQTTFEHLLVDEHGAFGLGCHYQNDTDEVRCEARPRCIGDGEDAAVHEGLHLVMFLSGDENVVATEIHLDAEPAEHIGDDAQLGDARVLDGDFAARHGGHTDETAHLNHVSQKGVFRAVQATHTVDGQQVGTYALDVGAHVVEHGAKLDQIWLASGVENRCGALGHHGGHDDVGRAGDGGLVKEHVAAFQSALLHPDFVSVEIEEGTEFLQTDDVGVESASPDFVAARLGHVGFAEAGQHRASHHHAASEFRGGVLVVLAPEIVEVDGFGLQSDVVPRVALNVHAHAFQKGNQVVDVQDVGQVVYGDFLLGEQAGAENLHGLVFRALRNDFALQSVAAFDFQ